MKWLWAIAFCFFAVVAGSCSKAAESGESCEKNSDCASGTCALLGACAPGDCTCTGDDCGKIRSSCDEGFVCTAGQPPLEVGYNRCRAQCSREKACPSDQHCSGGICRDGPESFALAWVNIPRTTPCRPGRVCEYTVRPIGLVEVELYSWTFGNQVAVETKEPTASTTYPRAEPITVKVQARAKTGAVAELEMSEVLCVGTIGAACDVSAPCCEGACRSANVCK